MIEKIILHVIDVRIVLLDKVVPSSRTLYEAA